MIRLILIGGAIYVVFLVVLACFQRRLIYFPTRATEAEMLKEASFHAVVPWRDAAGSIVGWKSSGARSVRPAYRMIVFHGNAGNALDRVHLIQGFERLDGGSLWEIYLFEYPGYGARKGSIGEAPFRKAASEAIDLLAAGDPRAVCLLGESLGAGLACAMAHDRPGRIAGLFLITPFESLRSVAQAHNPIVPVRLLLFDRWDNIANLSSFRAPLFLLAAGSDSIVPHTDAKHLFEAAREPKRMMTEPGADHNGLDFSMGAPIWEEVSDFFLSHSSDRG